MDISLLPVAESDAAWIQTYASDPRISATCNVPYPYPENGAEAFVRAAIHNREQERQYVFAILSDGAFAGLVTLNDVDKTAGTAALDYWIAVLFWGRGIGTRAARLAVRFAFDELGLRKLHSGCLAKNPASARVLLKSGFRETEGMIHDGASSGRFADEPIRLFEQTRSDHSQHS